MKFNLLFASVALSAVMAVPSSMSAQNEAASALTTNAKPAENRPAISANARVNLRKYFNPDNYRKLLLEKRIDAKLPGINAQLRDSLVQSIVTSIHDGFISAADAIHGHLYRNHKDFVLRFADDVADFLEKRPDRLPKYTDRSIAFYRGNPDALQYVITTHDFIKEFFLNGSFPRIEAEIAAHIKANHPNVFAQFKEANEKYHDIHFFPEEYYQRFASY